MRALSRIAAAAMLSTGFGGLSRGGGGHLILGSGTRGEHKDGPGGPRVRPATKRAREAGAAKDPFFGIASKGRTGAKARAALMAEAYAKTGRRNRDVPSKPSKPFKSLRRNVMFVHATEKGVSHTRALKLARRVTA